jgi:cytosine deaminase
MTMSAEDTDLVLRGGQIAEVAEPADIIVRRGVITEIGPAATAPANAQVVDLEGRLVLPGLVDAHCHLDKTLFGGPWVPHPAGDALADRIASERTLRSSLGVPNVDRITALLEAMVAAGTTHVRSHTDIAPELGLSGVEAIDEAATGMAGRIDIQQVVFPQYGILREPGTAELMAEALAQGVEVVGGIDPAGIDGDPVQHLDIVFDLAERFGKRIDIHLHDGGTLGTWQLELMCDRTVALGLQGRVTVSHAYGLGQASPDDQRRLANRLAEAGITITTAAVYNFPVPSVRILRASGVNVASGHDGIRDLWGPYGTGDMLDRAMHLAYRSTFRRDDDIELALQAATSGGATALGLPSHGLVVGAPADLVVVRASKPAEAVVTRPVRDLVFKAGRLVARDGACI